MFLFLPALCCFVCHTNHLHVLLHLFHKPPLWSSPSPLTWHLSTSFSRYTPRHSFVYSPFCHKSFLSLFSLHYLHCLLYFSITLFTLINRYQICQLYNPSHLPHIAPGRTPTSQGSSQSSPILTIEQTDRQKHFNAQRLLSGNLRTSILQYSNPH